jgi:hypothetical protein
VESVGTGWNSFLTAENRWNQLEVDGNVLKLVKVLEVRGK